MINSQAGGRRLRATRKDYGYRLDDIVEKINGMLLDEGEEAISVSTLSRYENGRVERPDIDILSQLAFVYHIPLEELLMEYGVPGAYSTHTEHPMVEYVRQAYARLRDRSEMQQLLTDQIEAAVMYTLTQAQVQQAEPRNPGKYSRPQPRVKVEDVYDEAPVDEQPTIVTAAPAKRRGTRVREPFVPKGFSGELR